MAITNPDVLIPIIQETLDLVLSWRNRSSGTLYDAEELQRSTRDVMDQTRREVRQLKTRTEDDRAAIRSANRKVSDAEARVNEIKLENEVLVGNAGALKGKVGATLQRCLIELDKARQWLVRAETRLIVAQKQLDEARYKLNEAEAELRRAQADLNACRSRTTKDKEGRTVKPNCSGEKFRVLNAETAVGRARRVWQIAKNERDAAQLEVDKARARVALCEKAVARAQLALSMIPQLYERAYRCRDIAAQAAEEVASADRNVKKARDLSRKQQSVLDEAIRLSKDIDQAHSHANRFFSVALKAFSKAYEYASRGMQEMEVRNESLREFASIEDTP